jgi:hypothetical protein
MCQRANRSAPDAAFEQGQPGHQQRLDDHGVASQRTGERSAPDLG